MIRKWVAAIFLPAVLLPCIADPDGAPKLELIGKCSSPEVSDAMKNTLQDQGVRVVRDAGSLCEIWFRRVLPQGAGTGTDYSTLSTGTFVGVVHYLSPGGDYRGQSVKPGTYTMRYQTMPSDGNHMGVAPTPDYCVLLQAAVDKDPEVIVEYQDILKLGKATSGLNHIYPLYLTAPLGSGGPAMRQDDEGRWALETKVKAQPKGGAETDFPIALVLVGKSDS